MNIQNEPQRFSLGKLESARWQIETAIKLWFEEGDTVSMHTVTAAAHRLVQDLLERQGKMLVPFEPSYLEKGREVEMKKMFREAETFFKHAKDHPQAILDFNPQWTEVYLLLAIRGYYLGVRPSAEFIVNLLQLRDLGNHRTTVAAVTEV